MLHGLFPATHTFCGFFSVQKDTLTNQTQRKAGLRLAFRELNLHRTDASTTDDEEEAATQTAAIAAIKSRRCARS